jgi:hypothetical protein
MRKMLFILFAGIFFWGCKKDSSSSNTGSNVKIRYELISTVNCTIPNVGYTNESGSTSMEQNVSTSQNIWSKEITYTNTTRPYQIALSANLFSNTTGKVTANIYINGTKKSTVTVDYQFATANFYQTVASVMYILE